MCSTLASTAPHLRLLLPLLLFLHHHHFLLLLLLLLHLLLAMATGARSIDYSLGRRWFEWPFQPALLLLPPQMQRSVTRGALSGAARARRCVDIVALL